MLDTASEPKGSTSERAFRWINADELLALVSIENANDILYAAMRMLSAGGIIAPERWAEHVSDHGRIGLMPGAAPYMSRFGVKVLSLFDAEVRGDRPSHQGVMLLFDLSDGRPLCAIDGAALTALRTASASAVATRALARPASNSLAIIGCGEQARLHAAALRSVLPIETVTVWNRTTAKAKEFAHRHLEGVSWRVCATPAEAVETADVICTLSSASEPLLRGADLRPGQHINLVGSSVAGPREVDETAVARAKFFVDSYEHASAQAAELLAAVAKGMIGLDHVAGEIGSLLSGNIAGRTADSDITIYKSLGHVVQDIAVAESAFRLAETRDALLAERD